MSQVDPEAIVGRLDTMRAQRLAKKEVGSFLRLASVQANSDELDILQTRNGKSMGLLARQWQRQADELRQHGASEAVLRGIQEHCYLFAYYQLCLVAETVGNDALSEKDIASVMDSLTQECFDFFQIDPAAPVVVDIPP
jgi:hypothetical protein